MKRYTVIALVLAAAAGAQADMTFEVTFAELQDIGDSANWYNDLDNSAGLGFLPGSYDRFTFTTTDGDFSLLDWVKIILPTGATLDSAAPALHGGDWGAWQTPAGVSLTGADGAAMFSFTTSSATTLDLYVDVDNDTALVRGAAGGGTSFEADGAKFVVAYNGNEYEALFTGISEESASSSVTVPAPGAALLAMLGLSIVGWIKRRLA